MPGRRPRQSNLIAVLAVVLAATCLFVTVTRPSGGRAVGSSGTVRFQDTAAARSALLAGAMSAGGAAYFASSDVKPVHGNGLFHLISFKDSGEIRGVCTTSVVGLQYKNTTTHDVNIWTDNLDAPSGGYAGGPWAPGGTGGEAYTGSITWFVQITTGSGSSARYASLIVAGFHDGPDHGCSLQIEGSATLPFSAF